MGLHTSASLVGWMAVMFRFTYMNKFLFMSLWNFWRNDQILERDLNFAATCSTLGSLEGGKCLCGDWCREKQWVIYGRWNVHCCLIYLGFLLIWSVYSHQVSANLLISIIKQIPLCTFGRNIILVPQVESHYEYYIQGSFGFYISVHIASLLSVVQSSAAAMTEFSSGDR